MQSTYTVAGMTCGHCVNHVTEEVRELSGVTDVHLTLDDGLLVVTSDAPIEFTAIKEAVSEAGSYEVVQI